MKLIVRYGFLLLLLATSCKTNDGKTKLPDMRHSYSKRSKKPMGTFTAFSMLKEKYSQNTVEIANKKFHKNVASIYSRKGLFVIITGDLLMGEDDLNAALNYAERGNQLFISAEYFTKALMDTLGIKVEYPTVFNLYQMNDEQKDLMRYSSVAMKDSVLFGNDKYGFFYTPFLRSFIQTDSTHKIQKLGVNEKGEPDYISLAFGNGRIFLHLHPEAFSNYFLLSKNNKTYFENVFSYTAPQRSVVYWDDYYRQGNLPGNEFSMFAVFLAYPMLTWALLIALAGILLYVSFASKRKQRIVPIKKANTNDTVSFAETIGRLYLQKKDNHNIADKMITYFLEHIRTHYYLNTSQINSEFFSSLSRKSGVGEREVKAIFQTITYMQQSASISDQELLELNNHIQLVIKK